MFGTNTRLCGNFSANFAHFVSKGAEKRVRTRFSLARTLLEKLLVSVAVEGTVCTRLSDDRDAPSAPCPVEARQNIE